MITNMRDRNLKGGSMKQLLSFFNDYPVSVLVVGVNCLVVQLLFKPCTDLLPPDSPKVQFPVGTVLKPSFMSFARDDWGYPL